MSIQTDYASGSAGDQLTTSAGNPIADNQNSLTAGPRGPSLLQDYQLIEKLAHQKRERENSRAASARQGLGCRLIRNFRPLSKTSASPRASISALAGASSRRTWSGSYGAPIVATTDASGKLSAATSTAVPQLLEDLAAHHTRESISKLRKTLLVFHSPVDATVDISNAAQIFRAAKHPKSFVSLNDADHLLTRASDCTFVSSILASWVNRHAATTFTSSNAHPV